MADTTHRGYSAASTTVLSTELNSLASGAASAASGALDNGTLLDLFADLTFNIATQGAARTAGAFVSIYIIRATDGSTYDGILAAGNEPRATFTFDAATTTWQFSRDDVPLPPGLYKWYAVNNTGQALAASGNTLKQRNHSIKTL